MATGSGWASTGARPLNAEEPVAGLGRHEARAYATWAGSLGGDLTGAVLQHEYQWEIAARAGHLQGTGRVWEWCANPFSSLSGFQPLPGAIGLPACLRGPARCPARGQSLHPNAACAAPASGTPPAQKIGTVSPACAWFSLPPRLNPSTRSCDPGSFYAALQYNGFI
jgi:formylglycine-generating enzyme required for sulfatase activity